MVIATMMYVQKFWIDHVHSFIPLTHFAFEPPKDGLPTRSLVSPEVKF